MPRVAPVIAQDTIFSFVDIKGSDKWPVKNVEEGKEKMDRLTQFVWL
jgi:hypothetical protein